MTKVASLVGAALLMANVLLVAQGTPRDTDVKAAYLLNFGRFATWPADAASVGALTFNVCVLGRDPFGPALDQTVTGESIDGKGIAIMRVAAGQDVSACRILFVAASEESKLSSILPEADKAGALTVSDAAAFADRGGMIQFVTEGRRIRFRVNAAAVEHAGLSLSSQLLRVATAVTGGATP